MSSFAKMIINNLQLLWLPQVCSMIKTIKFLQIDSDTIISFLCQFYPMTSSGYKIC